MTTSHADARHWLRENGYDDIADLIDQLIARWRETGKGTRRNWWDVLAGDQRGNSKKVDGIEFPVLRAAQVRQGRIISSDALSRDGDEVPPQVQAQKRWDGHISKRKQKQSKTG